MSVPFSSREALLSALAENTDLNTLGITRAVIWSTFAPVAEDPAGPWLVLTKVSGQEESDMDGDASLTHPRYQLTIGGTDKETVDSIQAVICKQFNGVTYTYTDSNSVGHEITIFHEDDRDGWDDATRTYRPSVDVRIWANT